jgi:myosin V
MQGERSFHIFYQMIRGAKKDEREAWKLPDDISFFKYLSGPGAVSTIEGVDDAKDFAEVLDAMTAVKIDKELQQSIFATISAVLWLGNVTFVAKSDDETRVNMDEAFQTVCELLGVPPERLVFALTHRLMTVGQETYEKTLNLEKSIDTRDALAKALYAAVFGFIVDRVNMSLASEKRLSGKFIAILDIYGFESFKKNSFEQLCINYANERLQQQFNKHLFKLEQVLSFATWHLAGTCAVACQAHVQWSEFRHHACRTCVVCSADWRAAGVTGRPDGML